MASGTAQVRLRMLETLAESPLRLPATTNGAAAANGAASTSRSGCAAPAAAPDDPELATALTMLKLEQEEQQRLQQELAAVRNESRGSSRYREVMQQTVRRLEREVEQLHEAAAQVPDPQQRAAAALARTEHAKWQTALWVARQHAARQQVRGKDAPGPDIARPRAAGYGVAASRRRLARTHLPSPSASQRGDVEGAGGGDSRPGSRAGGGGGGSRPGSRAGGGGGGGGSGSASREGIEREVGALRGQLEALLPEVQTALAEAEILRAAIAQLEATAKAAEAERAHGRKQRAADRKREALRARDERDEAALGAARARAAQLQRAMDAMDVDAARSATEGAKLEAELATMRKELHLVRAAMREMVGAGGGGGGGGAAGGGSLGGMGDSPVPGSPGQQQRAALQSKLDRLAFSPRALKGERDDDTAIPIVSPVQAWLTPGSVLGW